MSLAATQSVAEIKARNKQLIDEVLKVYPEKTAKRRAKHLNVHEAGKSDCGVKSNLKSIPGVMTIRGCAYAGSKGVVWGPIKDMIHISHGPVGCGQYSWAARRNYYIGTTGIDTFVTMQFTSDFQEKDIVFGGDKKLAKIIDEIQELFPLNHGIIRNLEILSKKGTCVDVVEPAPTTGYASGAFDKVEAVTIACLAGPLGTVPRPDAVCSRMRATCRALSDGSTPTPT